MSGSVEICIRGCQIYSIPSAQDVLNILTGSLLENDQDGEPLFLSGEEIFSGECLTDGECKLIHHSLSHLGACPQRTCMSSQAGPGALGTISASKKFEQTAEAAMKSDNCKNRSVIPGKRLKLNGACKKATQNHVGDRART